MVKHWFSHLSAFCHFSMWVSFLKVLSNLAKKYIDKHLYLRFQFTDPNDFIILTHEIFAADDSVCVCVIIYVGTGAGRLEPEKE